MCSIQQTFDVAVGYSDHTVGIEVPLAAVALGALVIEKHFTVNRLLPGPDHKASIEPHELASMVRGIRNVEIALGSQIKSPVESERSNLRFARKSIYAGTEIRAGETFTSSNLVIRRPADGRSPMDWDQLIGTRAERNYLPGEVID
jgi:N,N'-diacetyllegionaminate synthase